MVNALAPQFTPNDARTLVGQLETLDVPIPRQLARALEVHDLTIDLTPPSPSALLDMDDDAIRAYTERMAIRSAPATATGGYAYQNASIRVGELAVYEAGNWLVTEGVEHIITVVRPTFDKAAKVITEAAMFGLTSKTTAAEILDMDNPKATAAWRAIPPAAQTLGTVLALRVLLSKTLGVSPTPDQADQINSQGYFDSPNHVYDWTVTIAAGDGWSFHGDLHLNQRPASGIDWLAVAGRGGLHLNTPAEVDEKVNARLFSRHLETVDAV